jgi:predicted neuraminidase
LDQAPSTRLENPSIIQSRNGHLHLVYVINQNRFKHVRLDPTAFQTKPIVDGAWPVN